MSWVFLKGLQSFKNFARWVFVFNFGCYIVEGEFLILVTLKLALRWEFSRTATLKNGGNDLR
tara:strand:- start:1093 stop:1278 length:186 start_codon:yes stop_codon:yes gene_type:complete